MERESNPMPMCRSGCGFYGNPAQDGLCSVCHKDALRKKQTPPVSSTPVSVPSPQQQQQTPPNFSPPTPVTVATTNTAQPTVQSLQINEIKDQQLSQPPQLPSVVSNNATNTTANDTTSGITSPTTNTATATITTLENPIIEQQTKKSSDKDDSIENIIKCEDCNRLQNKNNDDNDGEDNSAKDGQQYHSRNQSQKQQQQQPHQHHQKNTTIKTTTNNISDSARNLASSSATTTTNNTIELVDNSNNEETERRRQFCLKRKCLVAEDANSENAGPSISDEQDDKESDDKDSKKKKNRCAVCRKKVGLTGFECRCAGLFCAVHRYSDKHDCTFDYREHGAQEIRRNNPVVVGEKIQKI